MNSKFWATALVVTSVLAAACAQTKQLGEMHDSTQELDKKTGDMSAQMKVMAGDTLQINQKTGEMYTALRQGDSMLAREKNLENLVHANDTVRKLSIAAKYFMSFEFQLWSGLGQDTLEHREELKDVAAMEFMRDVQELVGQGQTKVNPFAKSGSDRDLMALAVTMHLLNSKQEEMFTAESGKRTSIYSLLQDSLRANIEISAGRRTLKSYPGYVKEFLSYPDIALLLLQARYNFLATMTVAKISNIQGGMMAYLETRLTKWTANVDTLNEAQLEDANQFMHGALEVRDFMTSVGIKPVLDSALQGVMTNGVFPTVAPGFAGAQSPVRAELIERFEAVRTQSPLKDSASKN